MIRLSPRLKTIIEKVPSSKTIVDVGTDHGLVAVYLVKEGIAESAIATDISAASLRKAEILACREGVESKIDLREGDGLAPVRPGEVDTVIIAGVGGILIKSILERSPAVTAKTHTFVLQPMVAQDVLREWLVNNGYAIVDEALAKEEDRFYEIIVAKHGVQSISKKIYYEVGYKLIENRDPYLAEFLRKKIEKTKNIIEHLRSKHTPGTCKRLVELEEKLKEYEEVYLWDVKYRR